MLLLLLTAAAVLLIFLLLRGKPEARRSRFLIGVCLFTLALFTVYKLSLSIDVYKRQAKMLDVSQPTLSAWEGERKNPSVESLIQMSELYGVPMTLIR